MYLNNTLICARRCTNKHAPTHDECKKSNTQSTIA